MSQLLRIERVWALRRCGSALVVEQEPSGFHCIDEALSTIANLGSVRTLTALTVLKTRYATKWKALTLSTGSQGELRPHGCIRARSFHLAPSAHRTADSQFRSRRLHARRVPSWRRRR